MCVCVCIRESHNEGEERERERDFDVSWERNFERLVFIVGTKSFFKRASLLINNFTEFCLNSSFGFSFLFCCNFFHLLQRL